MRGPDATDTILPPMDTPASRPPHPETCLTAQAVAVLRDAAADAERAGRLQPAQLRLVHDERWLRIALPPALGGHGFDLPALLRLEEALAWADGSTGWVVTLCAGAAWFAGFLDPALAARVFADAHACIAGSGAASGEAEATSRGWRLRGRWRHASGIEHATAVTANCRVVRDGAPLRDAGGAPVIRAFLLEPGEYRIEREWHAMGMVATGSHAFAVEDAILPAERSFAIEAAAAVREEPLYRVPFAAFAALTLAVNLAGLTVRFLDLCAASFTAHGAASNDAPRQQLVTARDAFDRRRARLYASAEALWQACSTARGPADALLAEAGAASDALVGHARAVLAELYPHGGLRAADTRNPINRVWRDFHTASQHALFTRTVSRDAGA